MFTQKKTTHPLLIYRKMINSVVVNKYPIPHKVIYKIYKETYDVPT